MNPFAALIEPTRPPKVDVPARVYRIETPEDQETIEPTLAPLSRAKAKRRQSVLSMIVADKIVTADAMAFAIGVTPRTVYRDVAALIRQGHPIKGAAALGYWLEET